VQSIKLDKVFLAIFAIIFAVLLQKQVKILFR